MAKSIPTTTRRDLELLGMLCGMSALAWLTPRASWHGLAHRMAKIRCAVRSDVPKTACHIAAILGRHKGDLDPEEIVFKFHRNNYLERLQLLRYHAAGRWAEETVLLGREHVDEAVGYGQGVILWVAPFMFGDLATKVAFHRAGYRVSHLSRYMHNFSDTRLGARLLNPIRTSVENRFLAERIVMAEDNLVDGRKPLDVVAERLRAGGIVSITVSDAARRKSVFPILDGSIGLASGPAFVARRTGAAILPVFTVREPDGRFVTHVDPPLRLDQSDDPQQAIDAALHDYARIAERYLLPYADQIRWVRRLRAVPVAEPMSAAAE